jgi:hypothetical protein
MNWAEFHQAVLDERDKFFVPAPYSPIAETSEDDVWKVLVHLDKIRKPFVEKIIEEFSESKKWVFESDDDRVLVWLRLNFATEAIGFLTLGMPSFAGKMEWSPLDVPAKIHDAADEASLWKWFLIDAWNRSGITQIVKVLRGVQLLRGAK